MNCDLLFNKNIQIDKSTPPWKKELIIRKRFRSLACTKTNSGGGQTKIYSKQRCPFNESNLSSSKTAERRCVYDLDFHLQAGCSNVSISTPTSSSLVGNMKFVSEVVERENVNCAIENRRRLDKISFVNNMYSKLNNSIDINEGKILSHEKRLKFFKSTNRFASGCKMKDKITFPSRMINGEDGSNSDSSEELQYGPGIVNRLKTKYLSMTLRENQKNGSRPTLSSVMRKANSLDNLLEDENLNPGYQINSVVNCISKIEYNVGKDERKKSNGYFSSNLVSNDLKRTRSMETLNEDISSNNVCIPNVKSIIVNKPKNVIHQTKSVPVKVCDKEIGNLNMVSIVNEDIVIVENTTQCKKDTNINKPRNNSVEDRELPPPDVVKETLKLFECCQSKGLKIKDSCQTKGLKTKTVQRMNFKQNTSTNNVRVEMSKPPLPNKPAIYPKPTSVKRHFNEIVISNEINGNSQHYTNDDASIYNHITNGVDCKETTENKFQSDNFSECATTCISESPPISVLKVNFELYKTELSPFNSSSPTNKTSQKDDKSAETKNIFENRRDTEILKTNLPLLKQYSTPLYVDTGKCSSAPNDKLNKSDILKISDSSPVRQVGIIRPLLSTTKCDVDTDNLHNGKCSEKLLDVPNEKSLFSDINNDINLKSYTSTASHKNVHPKSTNHEINGKSSALWSKQPWNQQQNTMIFNFSNRKEVPDYIENDGLLLGTCRSRTQKILRENCGTAGVIILNNVHDASFSEESSTDSPCNVDETLDKEDWHLINGPPSPCNIQFEGDNIVINGKSNLRKQSKQKKLKIQFNDSSTITFEYPSESSLLEDELNDEQQEPKELEKDDSFLEQSYNNHNNSENASRLSSTVVTNGVPSSVTGGGGNLASYVPSKTGYNEKFQLGITRCSNIVCADNVSINGASTKWSVKMHEENNYLKPAQETENVAWSEESLPDLLF